MKKHKRFMKSSVALLVLLLLATQCLSISFAVEDTTPPEFVSGKVERNSVKPGENLKFDMNFKDEDSGTSGLYVEWANKDDTSAYISQQYYEVRNSGTYELNIPKNAKAGSYECVYIAVHDNAQNHNLIDKSEQNKDLFEKLDFVVEDVGQDTEAPIVKSIKKLTKSLNAPGSVEYEIKVVDNSSGIKDGGVGLNFKDGSWPKYEINKIDEYTYKFILYVDSVYEKYEFDYLQVGDNANNWKNYTAEDLGVTDELDVIPENYIKDSTAPELLSFSYDKDNLMIPDFINIHLDINEKESGFGMFSGKVYLKSDDGKYYKEGQINYDNIKDESNVRIDFNFSEEYTGKIYVDKVVLEDIAGNKSMYSVEEKTLEKRYFEVYRPEEKYTLVVNSEIDGYIDKITELPEGSTVLCNVSRGHSVIEKELFDALKGRDIEVTFMSIYGSDSEVLGGDQVSTSDSTTGIQWIINGKDIKNETKDVDMKMMFSKKMYSPYLVNWKSEYEERMLEIVNRLNASDMTPEESQSIMRKEEKKLIKEYFDSLVKEGYVIPKEVYEHSYKVIDTYDTTCQTAILDNGYIEYLSLEFANNGLLPCKTKIRMKPSYALRAISGSEDMLLYYNNGGKYEVVEEEIDIGSDGYCEFVIDHNSEYCLTSTEFKKLARTDVIESETETHKQTSPRTGDESTPYEWLFVGGAALIAAITLRKYKKQ